MPSNRHRALCLAHMNWDTAGLIEEEVSGIGTLVTETAQEIQYQLQDQNNSETLPKLIVQLGNFTINQNLSTIYKKMGYSFKILAKEGFDIFNVSKEKFCYEI